MYCRHFAKTLCLNTDLLHEWQNFGWENFPKTFSLPFSPEKQIRSFVFFFTFVCKHLLFNLWSIFTFFNQCNLSRLDWVTSVTSYSKDKFMKSLPVKAWSMILKFLDWSHLPLVKSGKIIFHYKCSWLWKQLNYLNL